VARHDDGGGSALAIKLEEAGMLAAGWLAVAIEPAAVNGQMRRRSAATPDDSLDRKAAAPASWPLEASSSNV
jgi:hypothetical protein